MGLTAEEKRRFLKALEEDQEFRYAVAGLLGLGEVLKRLEELRQDFNNYVKRSKRRWRQNERRWRQNEKRWELAYKRFDDIERMLSNVETTLGAVAESQYSRYV